VINSSLTTTATTAPLLRLRAAQEWPQIEAGARTARETGGTGAAARGRIGRGRAVASPGRRSHPPALS